ncbi:hypothetical protein FZO89_13365 [Luteimonas viscosa]|uniref:DUF4440 domain-containing protein n=1 Tax=Luteimonas viscosa TaxID=1132694 RepID=A0A5D4XRH1_9GAMM|nr:hypothetical protein [Luteimonas viscosa]TYT27169.1 hypothetical protein FZO89_13365 [Luteimonas viscosa]
MPRARLLLPLLLLPALAALLALRGCDRGGTDDPPARPVAATLPADAAARAARDDEEAFARAELRDRHDAAMRAAVSTLHRYLAKLPEDHVAADAFWADGRPPRDADEADLRGLPAAPSFFRTRNRSPEALGTTPVPAAVRIPVQMRLGLRGESPRHYSGWYELRHDPAQDTWQLTGASIDAMPARQ